MNERLAAVAARSEWRWNLDPYLPRNRVKGWKIHPGRTDRTGGTGYGILKDRNGRTWIHSPKLSPRPLAAVLFKIRPDSREVGRDIARQIRKRTGGRPEQPWTTCMNYDAAREAWDDYHQRMDEWNLQREKWPIDG